MKYSSDELHIISMSGPTWIHMLQAREERIISKMYGEFRNGRTDHLSSLAELACVRDQIGEIKAAIRTLTDQKEKLHATGNADDRA